MPDLVGDYVGLRELARLAPDVTTTKAALKILEEACIEIHLLIDGAVERTHRRAGEAAAGLGSAAKHDQSRRLIALSSLVENLLPLRFRTAKNRGHEAPRFVRGSSSADLSFLLRLIASDQSYPARS